MVKILNERGCLKELGVDRKMQSNLLITNYGVVCRSQEVLAGLLDKAIDFSSPEMAKHFLNSRATSSTTTSSTTAP